MPDDDLELVRQLRVEWRNAFEEGMQIRDRKGYVDSEAREKAERVEVKLNRKTDELIASQSKRLDDQQAQIKGLMERASRPPGGGGMPALYAPPSVGEQFVSTDEFRNCNFSGKFHVQASIKTRIRPDFFKAAGGMGVPGGTYPSSTTHGGVAPGLPGGPPLASTQSGVVPAASPPGVIVQGGITQIVPPAGAYPIFPYRFGIIPQAFPPRIMRDIVPVIPLDGTNAVEYVRENWDMSVVDYQIYEGDRKAMGTVTYTDYIAPVRTIAWYVKVSRQMAMDVPFVIATIEQRLNLGVMLKEDREILYGDNSAGHLWGIMPQATPSSVYYATPPVGANSIDQLNAAETYVEMQYYVPTAIIMNPIDESKLESLKTTYGSYVLADRAPREDGLLRLWGLPIYTTPVMNQGDYLVGAFPGNCALFDREIVTVEIAFQNEDDFVRNLITIRAEERIAFAVFVPKAFAAGPFTTPPANVPGYIAPLGDHPATPVGAPGTQPLPTGALPPQTAPVPPGAQAAVPPTHPPGTTPHEAPEPPKRGR